MPPTPLNYATPTARKPSRLRLTLYHLCTTLAVALFLTALVLPKPRPNLLDPTATEAHTTQTWILDAAAIALAYTALRLKKLSPIPAKPLPPPSKVTPAHTTSHATNNLHPRGMLTSSEHAPFQNPLDD